MDGVSFLPEKFAGAQEGPGGLFPAHDVAPLIDFQGQVTVRLNPFGIHRADDGLGRGTDGKRLGQLFPARHRDDGHFGRKALDVFRFLGEKLIGMSRGK